MNSQPIYARREALIETSRAQKPLTVAIAGNPNAGKTSLFNALTGLRQKVANYPGVTVERKEGLWLLGPGISAARVIDLPGLYSLEATSIDEQIARAFLLESSLKFNSPDVVIVAIDATNLVRNFYLLSQIMETGTPVVVALTMFDLAQRRVSIDVGKLSKALGGVPVIPVVANKRLGIDELAMAVLRVAESRADKTPGPENYRISPILSNGEWQEKLVERYRWIENVVTETVTPIVQKKVRASERIDAVVTHKVAGPAILALVMLLMFQAIFSWANLPMEVIDRFFNFLSDGVRVQLPTGLLTDLIALGIIPGVGGVVMFLPQIVLLFFFITLLEDSGYMARAAFLMDRLMRSAGLHGKSFIPLLSSFACAVPGIMATRTIENPKDRLTTILIAPLMSCSARLPIYSAMIAAFFSDRRAFGFVSLGTLIIFAMYLMGIGVAVTVAWTLKRTVLRGSSSPFVMELPPYRVPNFGNVVHSCLSRVGIFLRRAATVILAVSIVLWALVTFPRSKTSNAIEAGLQVEHSYAGQLGHKLEPLIEPLGFDWKIGVGLISSFAARETVISTLSIVYNVEQNDGAGRGSLTNQIRGAKRPDGSPVWTSLTALSLMVFFVLACQCMSTIAVVRRETNSWRWPLCMVGYMMVLAYGSAFLTYQGGRLLGFT
jgi:ferrous iron transport protein B